MHIISWFLVSVFGPLGRRKWPGALGRTGGWHAWVSHWKGLSSHFSRETLQVPAMPHEPLCLARRKTLVFKSYWTNLRHVLDWLEVHEPAQSLSLLGPRQMIYSVWGRCGCSCVSKSKCHCTEAFLELWFHTPSFWTWTRYPSLLCLNLLRPMDNTNSHRVAANVWLVPEKISVWVEKAWICPRKTWTYRLFNLGKSLNSSFRFLVGNYRLIATSF